MVKLVKFTRDSGCLTCDEFLVIFEGDHILIYMSLTNGRGSWVVGTSRGSWVRVWVKN